jgi:hypothetical protein
MPRQGDLRAAYIPVPLNERVIHELRFLIPRLRGVQFRPS